ncbi:MAG: regulatory iron-sulfur-containing complex subunit RicT [bacterium]|nr:regulatory iron-sulfur-containing complex subunit RicT [bacterium]
MQEPENQSAVLTPASGGSESVSEEMVKIAGIRSRFEARPVYYLADGHRLRVGDKVIFDAGEDEEEFGQIAENTRVMPAKYYKSQTLRKILRKAVEADLKKIERIEDSENRAFSLCQNTIREMKLPMELIEARFNFSQQKATFFFSAEGRVDFRRLVKSLSSQLSLRIEMRQIGVRDEAKVKGGCGDCGRTLCCSSFLKSFDPITVRMAKDQNLTLNPSKLSGACGRLKCCLRFEHSHYAAMKKKLPACKKKVGGCNCGATVIRQDLLKEEITLALETGERMTVTAEELMRLPSGQFSLKNPIGGAAQ